MELKGEDLLCYSSTRSNILSGDMTQQKCWHVPHTHTHTRLALLIYDLLTYNTQLFIAATIDTLHTPWLRAHATYTHRAQSRSVYTLQPVVQPVDETTVGHTLDVLSPFISENRDKWRKYVHGVSNRRIEDG